jgi:hypothetical protein
MNSRVVVAGTYCINLQHRQCFPECKSFSGGEG